MPDKFFASAKSRKRKRPESRPTARTKVPKKPRIDEDLSEQSDEWGGIDEIDLRPEEPDPGASGDEEEDETPAEKRLRLAHLYLDSVKDSLADGEFDAAEIDKELISSRLKQDVLEHSGKVHLFVADSYNLASPPILRTRGHRFSVTSALASESGKYLFTSGKEGNIIKWDLSSGKRLATLHKTRPITTSTGDFKPKSKAKATSNMNSDVKGHTDEVLALALSSDGKYLASGGRDRRLIIWDAETTQWHKTFQGPMNHKDVISALSFRKSTHQLFTASFDRSLKVYDLTPSVMGYVETLFGHQDSILALDSLRGDNCVSVGGRDKTARYWKIVEETQLVFRGGGRSRIREVLEGGLGADDDPGHKGQQGVKDKEPESHNFVEGSLECIAMIDEATFVTGGDSGSISLWTTQKKKPIFIRPLAHGFNEVMSSTEGLIQTPRWITALAALRYSDLFVSGSWEGQLRLWKLDNKLKSFALLGNIPIPGVINSLQIISPPKSFFTDSNSWIPSMESLPKNVAPALVVAGVGQEHRFGRWLSVKEAGASNGSFVLGLLPSSLSRTLS